MSDKIDEENPTPTEIKDLTLKIQRDMLHKVAEAMASYLKQIDAYSVNAHQLNINAEAFMIHTGLFCFKPRVLIYGSNRIKMDEYSSIHKKSIAITRPSSLVAMYTNHNGERVVRDLEGIEARYYQHELDNINGIDWRTRATQNARIISSKRTLH